MTNSELPTPYTTLPAIYAFQGWRDGAVGTLIELPHRFSPYFHVVVDADGDGLIDFRKIVQGPFKPNANRNNSLDDPREIASGRNLGQAAWLTAGQLRAPNPPAFNDSCANGG